MNEILHLNKWALQRALFDRVVNPKSLPYHSTIQGLRMYSIPVLPGSYTEMLNHNKETSASLPAFDLLLSWSQKPFISLHILAFGDKLFLHALLALVQYLINFLARVLRICCSLVVKSYPTLLDPMDQSMPGPPLFHWLPELGQIHVGSFDDTV